MAKSEIFMNLRTDFAFKKVFGTEAHKNVLLRFLNILFKKEGILINDVVFHDKEVLPEERSFDGDGKRGKRIVYDVYCTSAGTKHHFILEMQQLDNGLFNDRALFYTSKAISTQGKAGWDYELCPVYSIFILGFRFRHMSNRLTHDIRLIDKVTNEEYTSKLRMIFITLPEVRDKWEDCETEYEQILFIIKNIHKMDKESKAYKDGNYRDLFDASEIGAMAAEDVVLYSQSYSKMRQDELALEYAKKIAAEEGRAEGMAKGIAEGRAEGRVEGMAEGRTEEKALIARRLMEAGMTPEFVKQITGLDVN